MKLRRINNRLLLKSAIIYRLMTVGLEFTVLLIIFGEVEKAGIAAVIWNIINVGWYYLYHHWFARRFKVGLE